MVFNKGCGVDSESYEVDLWATNRRERCELKFKKSIIALTLLLLGLSASAWGNDMAPLNPAFERYMERSKNASVGETLSGRTPSPVDLSHLAGMSVFESEGKGAVFPATYDLRALGFVTPVRNQNPYGSCWTFSAMASLESSALRAGVAGPDYSEQFLGYFGYVNQSQSMVGFGNYSASNFPDIMDLGGDDFKAIALLARGTGAVSEISAPHGTTAPSASAPVVRALRNVYYFYYDSNTRYQKASVENIKQALMSHGAVSVGMYAGDPQTGNWDNSPYFNPLTYASYIPSGNSDGLSVGNANHAVTVVGWNDNYSKDNFNPSNRPTQDGAWIVKNSWGSTWGDNGYFYLSYYDAVLDTGAAYVGGEPATYDVVYQHDPLGWCSSYSPSGMVNNTAWIANVYTATVETTLSAVSFYAGGVGNSYVIYVYRDVLGGPTSGTLMVDGQIGSQRAPGYYTIPLSSPVTLSAGQKFSVVVRLTTPGYGYPVAVEKRIANYSDKISAAPGQSYISANGTTWTDMTSVDPTASACLKAFGSKRGSSSSGSLTVVIEPASAVADGAAWSIDGGSTWRSSGEMVSFLSPGDYLVKFKQLSGWSEKVSEQMPVFSGGSSTLTSTYSRGYSPIFGSSGGGCNVGSASSIVLLGLPLLTLLLKGRR